MVEHILNRLMVAYGVDTLKGLADKLDFTPQALYQWKKRGKIPRLKIMRRNPELNTRFLETGEGNVFDRDSTEFKHTHDYQREVDEAKKVAQFFTQKAAAEPTLDDIKNMLQILRSLIDSCLFMMSKVNLNSKS